jgi:GT2 family glycosyltransferase
MPAIRTQPDIEVPQQLDLSIIIVNWNSADCLRGCLASISRHTRRIKFQAIVVDNASYDGSEQIVKNEYPLVKFVQSSSNLGFARANNLGASLAAGEIFLFLNPDTEIRDDVFSRMVVKLRSDSSAGAAGARLLNTDGSLQASCVQSFPTILNQFLDFDFLRRLFPESSLWGMRALYRDSQKPAEVDAISGACFMAKKSAFENAGRFTEDYFMYGDDLDLSYKITRTGHAVLYMNDCEVIHHGGKSSSQQEDNFADLWQRKSMAQFFRRTHGRLHAALYRMAMAVISVVRIAVAICMTPFGGAGFHGKKPVAVLKKWAKIFCWAIGLENRTTPVRNKTTS